MDLWRIAVRAVAAFLYLGCMTRFSGKRAVKQANPFDFIVALIIGDLIDDALWAEVPMAKFAAAVGSIVFLDVLIKLACVRSRALFKFIDEDPVVAIRNGATDQRELRREQLNDGDLAHLLRRHGIENAEEVELGLFDRDHDLSVIRRWRDRFAQRRDRAALP